MNDPFLQLTVYTPFKPLSRDQILKTGKLTDQRVFRVWIDMREVRSVGEAPRDTPEEGLVTCITFRNDDLPLVVLEDAHKVVSSVKEYYASEPYPPAGNDG